MDIYETRALAKILRKVSRKKSIPVKPLKEKYYFFTQTYIDALYEQKYIRKGRIDNGAFTDVPEEGSRGFDSETMHIALDQHGEYVVDCYWKSFWRIILEIVLCLLSALVGGLVAFIIA
jgi:hypothetical protein